MNKPPFETNENIVNLVSIISEKLTRLEINMNKKSDLLLRKSSKIKSVNSSCAIEANPLSEEEVISVINGKTILAPQKKINEVKMHIKHIPTLQIMIRITLIPFCMLIRF